LQAIFHEPKKYCNLFRGIRLLQELAFHRFFHKNSGTSLCFIKKVKGKKLRSVKNYFPKPHVVEMSQRYRVHPGFCSYFLINTRNKS